MLLLCERQLSDFSLQNPREITGKYAEPLLLILTEKC